MVSYRIGNDRYKTERYIMKAGKFSIPCMTLLLSLIFGFVLPSYASAGEIREDAKGFLVGIKLLSSTLNVDESDVKFIDDDGGGLQIDFGYRFNPVFSLELSLGGAAHETVYDDIDAGFGMAQLMACYRFLPDRPFRPFVKGGFGGYGFSIKAGDLEYQIKGGGIALGGGFRYFITSHFAMGMDLTYNIIKYDTERISIDNHSIEGTIDEEGSQSTLAFTTSWSF